MSPPKPVKSKPVTPKPAPTKTRKPTGLGRDRTEVMVAVIVGIGIALVTALLIWALRPGSPGSRGEGGIMTRQPRVFLWLFLVAAVLAWAIYWVLNGRRRPRKVSRGSAVAIAAVIVVVAALIAAWFWPGGFLRQYPSFNAPDIPPVTEPTDSTTPGSTTVGSTTPGTTSASTTPPTSPPTTASTPTT